MEKSDIKIEIILDNTTRSKQVQKLYDEFGKDRVSIKYFSKSKLHAKILIFDDKVLWIGSSNFSNNTIKNNVETVLITDNQEYLKHSLKDLKRISNVSSIVLKK